MSAYLLSALPRIVQIIWLDLLLSGDNAIVIALACRSLPLDQRRLAAGLGAGAAIVLRLVFAAVILSLLALPLLKLVGALLLAWIAVRLTLGQEREEGGASAVSLWQAVRVIALADALMSLDNVLAITAAAKGDPWLVLFGLLLSLPLVVFSASLFVRLLDRFRWLLWVSAALIGWTAGQMAVTDPILAPRIGRVPHLDLWAGAGCAVLVLAIAAVARIRARPK